MQTEGGPETSAETRRGGWPALVAVLIGALVAVTLGVVGRTLSPGSAVLPTLGFSDQAHFKAWVATAVVAFAFVQLVTALWMFGRLPGAPPAGARVVWVHHASGGIAFVLSLPVAFYCLYMLGFAPEPATSRTVLHSLLGCLFYGAFVTKMLFLRIRGLPGLALAVVGGLVFSSVVLLWLTSTVWLFGTFGISR